MAIQVENLFRDEAGKTRSILSRQFISFSYGGKNIEDFNLIAVFNSDRLSKNIYSSFEDTTSSQEELDGQFYWRTKFNPNELQFNLTTDGITQKELDDFKIWFKPGIERELILSENHNRAIMARVSTTPSISMLPFEYEEEVLIGSNKIKTTTTIFKGDITLNFVMDDPYWYSLYSFLETPIADLTKEELKVIFEDNIPHISMLNKNFNNILLADGNIYNEEQISKNTTGILIDGETQKDAYLYYCGTAEEKPVLSFSMNIIKNGENGKVSFSKIGEDKFYYIKIGNNTLYFSLPSIMIAYNKIIDLFDSNENIEIIDFKKLIRDEIYDYYVRAYSIYYLTENENNPEWRNEFRNYMLSFFAEEQIIFNIDCKKGIVKIKATIKESNTALNKIIEENAGNMIKSPYLTISDRVFPINGKINNYILITSNSSINNFIIDYKYKFL